MGARRSWAVGICMVLGAFSGGFVAQVLVGGGAVHAQEGPAAEILKASAFVVVDAQGTERATLGTVEGGVGLVLKDTEGRRRLALGSPAVADPEGVRWVLSLYDEEETYRVLVAARDDGQGCGLGLWDQDGTARFGLGASPTGGGFSLWDAAGVERAGMGEGPTGVGISANDELGQTRILMGTGPDGSPYLVASDDQGNNVWSAPLGAVPPELP